LEIRNATFEGLRKNSKIGYWKKFDGAKRNPSDLEKFWNDATKFDGLGKEKFIIKIED
jgi:hypothetical protein